ncbi:MAG TPA: ATP-dependent helicase [Chloroflexia bacterium]|nr:ATP-dependent helicase [Chloroflexia bacterium]
MIPLSRFLSLVTDPSLLNRRIDRDKSQRDAVVATLNQSLFIIAGPGSGKTTVLTLRVLKLIFVDDVDPASILATTFTRKAAGELRSRILGWGDDLRNALIRDPSSSSMLRRQVEALDLNRVVTGTLDSIAEQTLSEIRASGTQPPIPLDEFVADALMQRFGLWKWPERRDKDLDFQTYVKAALASNRPVNIRQMLDFCRAARDRFLHDQVDVASFESSLAPANPGVSILCRIISDYHAKLTDDLVMDFASLEGEFLTRLGTGLLDRFLEDLRVVLVDEYQDTNYLQEQIYFAMARAAVAHSGSFTVVGDDDQSLYRFRGATVDLFANFSDRVSAQCAIQPLSIYLNNNYRSTSNIVSMYSDFVTLDSEYIPARVVGKPPLIAARTGSFAEYPILGIFRPDLETLAHDLAGFIDSVFNGTGVVVQHLGRQFLIVKDPAHGAIGDCALLSSSPREYNSGGTPRLPLLLRRKLESLPTPIKVFNPRGQEFCRIPEVQQVLGLMLECIDPGSRVQNNITNFPGDTPGVFQTWRLAAQGYIASNPPTPNTPPGTSIRLNHLSRFVTAWQNRSPRGAGRWPRETPLIELLYNLITWIPALQDDPEGLVYLEAVSRTITQSAQFLKYDAAIRRDPPASEESIKDNLWGIFHPLASGMIEISETLIEQLPRDRFNILSVHQSKGLEFPLVIVNVGSDFKNNHPAHAFKRFPKSGGPSQNLEDAVRPFSPLASLPVRPALDRAFDDLVRQYFVAYSRPQDVLLLVGLSQPNGEPRPIPNVAVGWTRDGLWPWQGLPDLVHI